MPATSTDLSGHDLIVGRILHGAVGMNPTDRHGRVERVIVRPLLRTTDYASGLRLAAMGGGIIAAPDLVAAEALRADMLDRVLPGWTVSTGRLYGISLGGRHAPARVSVFHAFICESLAGGPVPAREV